jgi:hypothetical protein
MATDTRGPGNDVVVIAVPVLEGTNEGAETTVRAAKLGVGRDGVGAACT